jgi:hypothetical protein
MKLGALKLAARTSRHGAVYRLRGAGGGERPARPPLFRRRASAASAPAAAPDISPTPTCLRNRRSVIFQRLKGADGVCRDNKAPHGRCPKNALGPEWRYPAGGIDYYAGTDLTYDEFTALIGGLAELSRRLRELRG